MTTDKYAKAEDPITVRGQAAWEILKDAKPRQIGLSHEASHAATGRRRQVQAERLRLWLDLGNALAVGKRIAPITREYHAWLKLNGFEFVPQATRANALWFANNAATLGEIPVGITSPATLRLWMQGQAARAAQRQDVAEASQAPSGSTNGPHAVEVVTSAAERSGIAGILREAAESLQHGADLLLKAARAIEQANSRE